MPWTICQEIFTRFGTKRSIVVITSSNEIPTSYSPSGAKDEVGD